ncbi:Zinc metalloprotease TldD [Candidatus Lokiarchaeum ossiferum]|uniref:Zinc metalloprotease TldD n=1 Tax=Candidatus Lokiarchaeum ossiferum TaxID=2951803 RepID=A0ABY6HW14_9ARCH|nr:Zinc metalloprotease TldD [Candidatus Lokiarchaeum sp. B-35]
MKTLNQVKNIIDLEPISLEIEDLDFLRDLAQKHNIQYFNARFTKGKATQIALLKGITKSANTGIGKGFSIMTFKDGGYGFAAGQAFSKDAIEDTFVQSANLAKWSSQFSREKYSIHPTSSLKDAFTISPKKPIYNIDPDEKVNLLLEIEKEAYFDPKIVSTNVNYSDNEYEQLIFNNFNRFVRIKNSGIFFILQAIAKDAHRQEGYHISRGGNGGYEILEGARGTGRESAENSLELLHSKPAPQGVHDLIMDHHLTGTFIHEAFGHAAEADSVIAGESILANKLNSPVGSELVSIIDDGTLEKEFGFIPYDDEGTPSQKTSIVDKGILVNYLHSLETASKMDVKPTGNGRAAGFSVIPQVRMTNTYLKPGDSSLDEMISEMQKGVLGIGWKYGYTDPITGDFTFKLSKAYLIENGEKTQVLRDAAISGVTLEVLQRISLISNKFTQDTGYCGKGGQSIPVGSGGPHTWIKDMVFGGQ